MARALRSEDDRWQAMLASGVPPLTVKARMDATLLGFAVANQRLGVDFGINTTNESGSSIDDGDPIYIIPQIPLYFATQWRFGAPPGLGYLFTGYNNTRAFFTSGADQGIRLIAYEDVGPNYDIFLGVKSNDVIEITGCPIASHNTRYTILYDVAAKGDNTAYGLTQGDFSGSGSDWTAAGSNVTVNGGAAIFSGNSASGTASQALSGMVSGAAYVVQFYARCTVGSVKIKVDIGGGYYWEKTFAAATPADAAYSVFSFVSNATSVTPTLTITFTWISGTPGTAAVDDINVYGFQGLVTVETLLEPSQDDKTVITLVQTAT